jgi:hypothetical protein
MWRLSINVGFSLGVACDERVEALWDRCRLRGDRSALVSHAIPLQHLAVEERAIRTDAGIDCLERVRIGRRRFDGTRWRHRWNFKICVDRSSRALSPKVPRFLSLSGADQSRGWLRSQKHLCLPDTSIVPTGALCLLSARKPIIIPVGER